MGNLLKFIAMGPSILKGTAQARSHSKEVAAIHVICTVAAKGSMQADLARKMLEQHVWLSGHSADAWKKAVPPCSYLHHILLVQKMCIRDRSYSGGVLASVPCQEMLRWYRESAQCLLESSLHGTAFNKKIMAPPDRLELSTNGLTVRRSTTLS